MVRVATHAARTLCVAVALSITVFGNHAVAGGGCGQAYGHGQVYPSAQFDPALAPGLDSRLAPIGRKLFFDPRLSATGRTACASCHDPRYAFAQPRRVATSDDGRPGRRNSPSLLDVRFFPTLMWDGSFCALEQQAFGPFQRGEMGIGVDEAVHRVNTDPQYVDLFRQAYDRGPTADGVARALAAFQRNLVSRDSRVDRFFVNNDTGALSPQEQHGYELFTRRAGCANCHQPFPQRSGGRPNGRPLFTDFQFHNLGVGYLSGGFVDIGRYELSRNPADRGAFRTPSLRNSARTAPYMHDGSLATLEDVVEFYNGGGQSNPNLSPAIKPLFLDDREKAALVAFLRALAD